MENFEGYISLGGSCKTRHQIDRVFGSRSEQYSPLKGYFDWLWGPGMDGVLKAIESDFKLTESNLTVKKIGGTVQVFDSLTGFYFLHDFHFSGEAVEDLSVAQQEMKSQMSGFLDKYSYLGAKSKDLISSGRNYCFVYSGWLSRHQVDNFFRLIDQLTPIRPKLLQVVPNKDLPDLGPFLDLGDRFRVKTADDEPVRGTPDEWMGDNDSWDGVFQDFGLA